MISKWQIRQISHSNLQSRMLHVMSDANVRIKSEKICEKVKHVHVGARRACTLRLCRKEETRIPGIQKLTFLPFGNITSDPKWKKTQWENARDMHLFT